MAVRSIGKKYDVFLSLRRLDTRDGFGDFLFVSLKNAGLRVFRDDEEILKGDAIEEIHQAIYDSKIFLPIFSEGYATSKWNLDEIKWMMECMEEFPWEKEMLPVFYHVTADDVKLNTDLYTDALKKHEKTIGRKTVKGWRKALEKVPTVKGWKLQQGQDQRKLVEQITEDTRRMLNITRRGKAALKKSRRKIVKIAEWEGSRELYACTPTAAHIEQVEFSGYPPSVPEVASWMANQDLERRSYDVFLSFRGPDSRHTIISHLYRALRRTGIHTFKDSPELEAGKEIPELFEAIGKSRIAIIMFSENYARSEWCLNELKRIMDLKDINQLTVVPIFYRVRPSEVRLDKKGNGELGSYQIAMEEMERKYAKDNSKMVQDWKRALEKAGNVTGFTLPEGEDEANCVEEVIKTVMTLLNRVPLTVAPCLIGINDRLREVKPLLEIDPHFNGILMLGIYGPGGVGKTTLSKAICNHIAQKFDDWCFISKVRDSPLIKLQKRLLRYLLKEKDLEVRSVDEGKSMIRHRLGNKRVLVILDDVDKPNLDALAGGIDWFGKGSRIIITTRNIRLLHSRCVHCKYEVKPLVEAEAKGLFRYHAFEGGPEDQHIDSSLVNQFLDYADGLPLALEVVGRTLRSRSASEWESILEKLKQEPPQDITSVLKISFDGLDKDGQELFLDIACFFNGWNKEYVEKVLASCGFKTKIDIKNLEELCLVTIEGGVFRMHHVLEEMGKNISQGKCSKLDEVPTRIWLYSDFCDLLSKNMVQERSATVGIRLNSDLEDQELISSTTFEDFKRLRLLIVRNALSMEGSLAFPSELRWFEWPKYAAPAIDFRSSRKLVGIDLRWSEITQILGKDFKELKYLNLYNCKPLESLPNLSRSSHLEELNLSGCEKLARIDNAVGSLDKLVHLNLKGCRNITEVPNLLRSKYFQTINFSGCCKLNQFPAIMEELRFLTELNLEITGIEQLPDSIGNLVAVKILNLSFCEDLRIIPSSIFKLQALEQLLASGCPKLEIFPRKLERHAFDAHGFPNLIILNLQYCRLKEVEFIRDLTCFDTLKVVYLSGNVFKQIPECISKFKSLEQLWLSYCKSLERVLDVPATVELHIMGCQNLQSLSSLYATIQGSETSFQRDLSNCPQLDLSNLNSSLSLEAIRRNNISADVIVAKEDFPDWMTFQVTDCDANYLVVLPEGISEDYILGLAISVTFLVTKGKAGRKSESDLSPELSLAVGKHTEFPKSDIDNFDGTHTWFVYIPRRPQSGHDSDHAADINWSNITVGFEAKWTRILVCGVRVMCKDEIDEERFMIEEIEQWMDREYEDESDNGSGEEEEQSPDLFGRDAKTLRRGI